MDLKPFTKFDWYGFAGAEPFADGSEPLIGELKGLVADLDGTPVEAIAVVVLDANGLSIMPYLADGEESFQFFVNFDHPYAARAAAALRDGLSLVEIKALAGATVLS